MKKHMILFVTLCAALFMMNGCIVTSLNPLYTEKDVIFMEELVGTWKGEGDDEIWMFSKKNDKEESKAYELLIFDQEVKIPSETDSGDTISGAITLRPNPDTIGKFEVHLVKLGEHLFLDMFPESPDMGNTMYWLHTIPVHSFIKVRLNDNTLGLTMLDIDWFEKKIENGESIGIDYVSPEDENFIILSAPTKELQEYMLKNVDNEEMYDDEEMMTRYKIPIIQSIQVQDSKLPEVEYR